MSPVTVVNLHKLQVPSKLFRATFQAYRKQVLVTFSEVFLKRAKGKDGLERLVFKAL